MLAYADMRPGLAIATILLVLGVAYVLFLGRRTRGGSKSARWVPWVSLAAGPLCGLLFAMAEIYFVNPSHYPLPSGVSSLLAAVLLLGTLAGSVAALVFGLALHLQHRRGSQCSVSDSDV